MSKTHDVQVLFKEKEIDFPHGYYFRVSAVHALKQIVAPDIAEVNLNTHPPSLVYQKEEVVFIPPEVKEELKEFATRNEIPIRDRHDIWEDLCRPYLDTEFDPADEAAWDQVLIENGISALEMKEIRKKIKKTMWRNAIVWEWQYLGLFDYLAWTHLTKKKYEWAMEIALRNFS